MRRVAALADVHGNVPALEAGPTPVRAEARATIERMAGRDSVSV